VRLEEAAAAAEAQAEVKEAKPVAASTTDSEEAVRATPPCLTNGCVSTSKPQRQRAVGSTPMRHHMLACQDRKPTTKDGIGGAPGCGFHGVFDGHGGRRTVDYIEKHLHTNLAALLPDGKTEPKEAMQTDFGHTPTRDETLGPRVLLQLDRHVLQSGPTWARRLRARSWHPLSLAGPEPK
jgi:hypothetical protein